MSESKKKMISDNRKARFNYHIIDRYEAGLVLLGTEVKSLRIGRVNLKDAYAKIVNGEVFVYQMHIGAYPFADYNNHEPLRPRKLLLHKYEIKRLFGKVNEKGFSLIPLNIYFRDGRVKMEIALAKGKQSHDKREEIRRRDQKKDMERALKKY